MIEQGGTGATAAGPMLKRIWDGLLGADGKKPMIAGEQPSDDAAEDRPQVQVAR